MFKRLNYFQTLKIFQCRGFICRLFSQRAQGNLQLPAGRFGCSISKIMQINRWTAARSWLECGLEWGSSSMEWTGQKFYCKCTRYCDTWSYITCKNYRNLARHVAASPAHRWVQRLLSWHVIGTRRVGRQDILGNISLRLYPQLLVLVHHTVPFTKMISQNWTWNIVDWCAWLWARLLTPIGHRHGTISCMDGTTEYRYCRTTLDCNLGLSHAFASYVAILPPERWTRKILAWNMRGPRKRGRPAYTWETALQMYSIWKGFDNWNMEAAARERWMLMKRDFVVFTLHNRWSADFKLLLLAP